MAQHLFVSVTWLYIKSCELTRFGFINLHTEHTQKSVTQIGILIKHISYVFVWLVVVVVVVAVVCVVETYRTCTGRFTYLSYRQV